jgi:hypothetical protein
MERSVHGRVGDTGRDVPRGQRIDRGTGDSVVEPWRPRPVYCF